MPHAHAARNSLVQPPRMGVYLSSMRSGPSILACFAATILAASTAYADLRPFSDYQIILDRMPFGAPPDPSAIPEVIVPVSESFAASIQLASLVEEDTAVRAAFIDRKDNAFFSLLVGETENGIELVDADYDREEAVLRKGNEVVVLSLRSDGESKVLTASDVEERTKQAAQRRASYVERRKARQLARAKPPEIPKPIYTGKELEEHLQDYAMEALRQGLPPLPIQLTPDRDDQLVAEGYLPPVDEEGYEIDVDAMTDEEYEAYLEEYGY